MAGVITRLRKSAKHTPDPVDEWLNNEGFFRKQCPKDATCLFRAVSDQVYLTQLFHIRVRNECVDFMRKNQQLFEEKISIPYDSYLDQKACFTEWGGIHEIEAISLRYKRDVIVFDGHDFSKHSVTNFGFEKFIYLCFTLQKQYDSVYTQEVISISAFCQSLVYKSLYKNVFKMEKVDDFVNSMLHDNTSLFKHDKLFAKDNLENRDQLAAELLSKMEGGFVETDEMKMIRKGHIPFPYRVAKALDPDIYRNIDFDLWHEIRREVKNSGWNKYKRLELQVGGKCLVDFSILMDDVTNNNDQSCLVENKNEVSDERALVGREGGDGIFLNGHIQEMTKNEGPVVVFILELGEKKIVPYSSLRPIPAKKKTKGRNKTSEKSLEQSSAFKEAGSPRIRRSKGRNGSPPSVAYEICTDKPSTSKKEESEPKWANESSESSRAADKFSPTIDFTADVSFSDEENTPTPSYNEEIDENLEKSSLTSDVLAAIGSENSSQLSLQQQNATYFRPPAENNYPVYPYYEMLPNVDFLLDQANQPINLSVSKSNDADCNDLPFSDRQSLRFFYNLGLQYFQAITWLSGANRPPVVNQPSPAVENSAGQNPDNIPGSQVSHEDKAHIENKTQQKNVLGSKNENSENGQGSASQIWSRNYTISFNPPLSYQVPQTQNNPHRGRRNGNRNPQFSNNERAREHVNVVRDVQRYPRSGHTPRYRRHAEGRNRNSTYGSRRSHQRSVDSHQGNRVPESRMEGQGRQYERIVAQGNHQNQVPHQVTHQVVVQASGPSYQGPQNQPQPPVYQPPMCSEGEPYCPRNPGLIPIPYIHQVDSRDNNASPFTQMVYTGIENYRQTYVPCYPPYYSGIAPANAQENLYQFPSRLRYIPSCLQFNPSSGNPPNGAM